MDKLVNLKKVTIRIFNKRDQFVWAVKLSDLEACSDAPDCEKCKKALKLSIMTQIHIGLTQSNSFTSEATELIMENVDISVSKIIDNMEVGNEIS